MEAGRQDRVDYRACFLDKLSRPASPEPKSRKAPGSGTSAAVPFKLNWIEVQGNPDPEVRICSQVKFEKTLVALLKEPVAKPPMFVERPPDGNNGPVKPADSDVRSAVMVDPLVLLLGKGFGPLVNNWPVKVPIPVLIEIGGMMFGRG